MSDPQPRREPTAVARDVVTELAHQHPDEFADFWRSTPEQQTKLIEQFGTSSDRELWHKRIMANPHLYAEVIPLNDRLLEVYKNIQHTMTSDAILQTRNSLLRISPDIETLLKKHDALTPERSASLAAASSELDQAASSAKPGDRAAFMRAHGHLNDVVLDVMAKEC
jgi:hypothetical protein